MPVGSEQLRAVRPFRNTLIFFHRIPMEMEWLISANSGTNGMPENRSTKLKLPDCIIAATAIVLNAVLLTADTELLHLHYSGFTTKSLTKV